MLLWEAQGWCGPRAGGAGTKRLIQEIKIISELMLTIKLI
jgi:hypothetical protein